MGTGPEPPVDGAAGAPRSQRPESYTWPLIAIVLVIAPQVFIPAQDRIGPPLVIPIIEMVALLILVGIAAQPGAVPRQAHHVILGLFATLALANAASAGHLVNIVLTEEGDQQFTSGRLLTAGALVLLTNVVTFGLLYWELDRGGPSARRAKPARFPDFEFPQTATPTLAAPDWQPLFLDYLYVAFTNIVAFSPTDTMPLTRNAKALMALQAVVSAAVLVVVVARVINILPT